MPQSCVVPYCFSNYSKTSPKVVVFSFPKDEETKRKWIEKINRKNWKTTEHSRVCVLHFTPADLIFERTNFDERTGVLSTSKLEVPQLHDFAVPSKMPSYAFPPPQPALRLEDLIDRVRERPPLYDHYSHKDRSVISALWKEIAVELNTTETECRERWHDLRSNFMRERRRQKVFSSSSTRRNNKKKWLYYDAMEFLIPCITSQKTINDTTMEEGSFTKVDESSFESPRGISPFPIKEEEFSDSSVDSSENRAESNVSSGYTRRTLSSQSTLETGTKRKNQNKAEDLVELCSHEEPKKLKQNTLDETDPDRLFLLSLQPMMQQLSPVDKIDIRIEIHEAFRRKLYPTQ